MLAVGQLEAEDNVKKIKEEKMISETVKETLLLSPSQVHYDLNLGSESLIATVFVTKKKIFGLKYTPTGSCWTTDVIELKDAIRLICYDCNNEQIMPSSKYTKETVYQCSSGNVYKN